MIEEFRHRVERRERNGPERSPSGSGAAMSGGRRRGRVEELDRSTAEAWNRFAAGDEVTSGVRPEILLSWARCRDDLGVDPARDRAPAADGLPPLAVEESVVAAELGAAAMSMTEDVRAIGGVVAVADGNGRVLAAWGDERTSGRGRQQNLGPLYRWSEPTTGTTGIGMALQSRAAVAVDRYEHWCTAFQDWSCAAVAVRDPMSDAPVGVIDISIWNRPLPASALGWLTRAVAGVEERLRERAAQAYGDLVDVFRAREPAEGGLAVLDAGGRLVVADEAARDALVPPDGRLRDIVQAVVDRARRDEGWVGTAELDGVPISVEPVRSGERVVGVLVRAGRERGEQVVEPAPALPVRDRLVGVRGARLLLVQATDVRVIETDGGLVWLDTDDGRMRAAERGLDRLEERLAGEGFLRVNRQALVNLRRVREIAPGFKGGFWLLVDGSHEAIPVSRRRVAAVRNALGL
jgi:hypothetical protein